jgi:7,8-dihydro-6-hydroxymethylpterin dimethyltransferase
VPAVVYLEPRDNLNVVQMTRTCDTHGPKTFTISSDARLYHEAAGPNLGDCCGRTKPAEEGSIAGFMGKNSTAGTPDMLASCVTLIEITTRCNMPCNICFAGAVISHDSSHDLPFDTFKKHVEDTIAKKGELEILQLSGGEPTVHPQFIDFVRYAVSQPKILCVLINTNGIKCAADSALMAELALLEEKTDKLHIYLQFDGIDEAGQVTLRGSDFRTMRIRALDACRKAKIPVTLAMTVNRENLPSLWNTLEFAIGREEIHGISYQPEFFSGRNPAHSLRHLPDPISIADVVTSLCASSGRLTFDDFTPTPCGHPMCQWIGWIGKIPAGYVTPKELGIDLPALQSKVGNRIRYDVTDLIKCQCETTELGQFIHQMEGLVQQSKAFRIFIKPFMDARSWDEDRIARCCTHVITPDGKLDSFCRHYADRNNAVGVQKRKINFLQPT